MKLRTIEQLVAEVKELKNQGKKIVLCHGVWDILHPGHRAHLKAAKQQGDILIVTVTPDRYVNKGPDRPAFSEELRAEGIADLEYVDYVAINQWPTAVETIKQLKPDVYVKGSDYADHENDITGEIRNEVEAVKSIGGRVHFTNEISFSSTELVNRYFNPYPKEAQEFLEDFRQRYSAEDVIKSLRELKSLKVLVVGDTIIDEYYYCQGLGKTPKDNIIAVKYLSQETFAGGVLAAANHIAGFCENVDLVTCLGTTYAQNNYEGFILSHLKSNIKVKFFYNIGGPTTVKRRFVDPAFLSKVFEVAYLKDILPEELHDKFYDYLKKNAPNYDLVLATDFGHGLIDQETARILSEVSTFLAVNTQVNSANQGYNLITKYPRANYACLDEPELRLAYHDKTSSIEELTVKACRALGYPRMAITRGHLGSMTFDREFHYTPVFSEKVVDRLGAGDAYLSITAPCVAKQFPMDLVGFIGNAVGALKVQIIGNKESVEPVPLFKFIATLLK